jgi:uncharacterized protein with HEPN domain
LLETYKETKFKDFVRSIELRPYILLVQFNTSKFTTDSDVDLMVDFAINDPIEYTDNYFDLKFELERILNRSIDLLENKAIKIHSLERILIDQKFSFMDNEVKTCSRTLIKPSQKSIHLYLTQKILKTFKKDLKTKRAVERNIEIIGEAMSRILKAEPNIKISNTRKIVDTRNRIAHGYDSVSEDILWGIIIRNLPSLETRG